MPFVGDGVDEDGLRRSLSDKPEPYGVVGRPNSPGRVFRRPGEGRPTPARGEADRPSPRSLTLHVAVMARKKPAAAMTKNRNWTIA